MTNSLVDERDGMPVSMSGAPSADDEKKILMREIMALLAIDGGRLPASAEEFWQQVGLLHQVSHPSGDVVGTARATLERLGERWEEDFAEADDVAPSLMAYESLHNRLKSNIAGDEDEESDEDEDPSGALAKQGQILVSGQDNPIQTIVQFIEDGTFVLDPDWQRGYVWKPRQRKKFIESVLLSLPIPPVLLFQDKDKKIYVIDGRQRLETVYRYRLGSSDRQRRFRTFDKNTPGWRENENLSSAAGRYFDKLPDEWQRHFNTFVIPARVFTGLSRRTLYEVFKRYNTGAVKLQAAEIRKAIYQGVPLHEMLFRISGEQDAARLADPQERRVAALLWRIMKSRTSRYGAYNFVGRCLAFAHVKEDLSVAAAINRFMDESAKQDPDIYRQEFLNAFEAVLEWYEHPLSNLDVDKNRVIYHEWIATMQVVSTIKAQHHIRANVVTEEQVRGVVEKEWPEFVANVRRDKQNTGNHWERQREWIRRIEEGCGIGQQADASSLAR
jgi:hypothetical protein